MLFIGLRVYRCCRYSSKLFCPVGSLCLIRSKNGAIDFFDTRSNRRSKSRLIWHALLVPIFSSCSLASGSSSVIAKNFVLFGSWECRLFKTWCLVFAVGSCQSIQQPWLPAWSPTMRRTPREHSLVYLLYVEKVEFLNELICGQHWRLLAAAMCRSTRTVHTVLYAYWYHT
jgi:hypothetical protein